MDSDQGHPKEMHPKKTNYGVISSDQTLKLTNGSNAMLAKIKKTTVRPIKFYIYLNGCHFSVSKFHIQCICAYSVHVEQQ